MQTFLCEIAFNWNYWRKASFCVLSRRVCFSSATPFSDWWRRAACNRRSPRRRFPSVWFYAWIPCSSVRWHWWFWEKSTHPLETPGMSGRILLSFRDIWPLKGDPAFSFFQSLWKTGGPSFWRKHRRWNVFHQRLFFSFEALNHPPKVIFSLKITTSINRFLISLWKCRGDPSLWCPSRAVEFVSLVLSFYTGPLKRSHIFISRMGIPALILC